MEQTIQEYISEWMGSARLDRLEEHAKNGHASPSQMLKLISEVRRRRLEMTEMQERLKQLEGG